jgi:hypothetical protein
MLRFSSAESKHEYSRYITLRSFNCIAYSCRTVDFLALMAAMALLLAHLDSHRHGAENPLAHQYLSDRAMIEQVQENMTEINRLNSDALSAQSADLLRKLLAIEVETGDGRVSVREPGNEEMVPQDGMAPEEEGVVSVHIPYFGIIRIAREVSTESQSATTEIMQRNDPLLEDQFYATTNTTTNSGSVQIDPRLGLSSHTNPVSNISTLPPSTDNTSIFSPTLSLNPLTFQSTSTVAPHGSATSYPHQQQKQQQQHQQQQSQNTFSDPCLSLTRPPVSQSEYPELAAGGEDWAFQGVDMAFFESIMRSHTDLGHG